MASSSGLLNSFIGKTLGDDDIENFIDTYARGLAKVI